MMMCTTPRTPLLAGLVATLFAAAPASTQGQIVAGTFELSETDCLGSGNNFYEIFEGSTFDLDGSAIEFLPNGLGSYFVVASGSAAFRPFGPASATSSQVILSDNEISAPQNLGFLFTFPDDESQDISTSQIEISSNGYVHMIPGTITSTRSFGGQSVLNNFLSAGPSFALYGLDLNPGGAGAVWFDPGVAATDTPATVTFDAVVGPSGFNSAQLQIFPNGLVRMAWNGVSGTNAEDDLLIGWSAGQSQPDLGPSDLSSPFLDGGNGVRREPLDISAPEPPIVNNPFQIDVSGLPGNTTAAALLIGAVTANNDLGLIGATGCGLFTNGDIGALGIALTGPDATIDFGMIPPGGAIPNDGIVLYSQVLALVPGINQAGVVSSRRGTITIGTDVRALPGLLVQLEGTRTEYCGDPPGGAFWSIRNNSISGETIQSVTLSLWNGGPMVGQGIAMFDTDGNCASFSSIGDFQSGNSSSTTVGCMRLNSFRGSDFSTGLVYAGTDVSGCDPLANTGWIGTDTNAVANDFGTLQFQFSNFTPGKSLIFDCKTSGLSSSMDLAQILVTFQTDQRTVSGQLAIVDEDTSIGQF